MSEQKIPRSVTGIVTSNRMEKTVTVKIERKVPHPLYKKYIRKSTKVHAHDEENQCQIGDVVTVQQCRPISKSKTWRLVKVVQSAV